MISMGNTMATQTDTTTTTIEPAGPPAVRVADAGRPVDGTVGSGPASSAWSARTQVWAADRRGSFLAFETKKRARRASRFATQ
jgi:hypothetical protein